MRVWLLLSGCLWLAGCAPVQRDVPLDLMLNRWVGHPIQDVINSWGPADAETSMGDQSIYTYSATRYGKRYYPANLAPAFPATVAGDLEEFTCKAVFEVDEAGVVMAAQWQGWECWEQP